MTKGTVTSSEEVGLFNRYIAMGFCSGEERRGSTPNTARKSGDFVAKE